MTSDEIIEAALQCGIWIPLASGPERALTIDKLRRFAALVAAAERATISELLDRLEVAEKERDFAKTEIARLHDDIRELTDVRVLDEEDRDRIVAWRQGTSAKPAPNVPTALLVAVADLVAQMEIVSRVGFVDTPDDKDSCAAFCVAEGTWLELMSAVESLASSILAAAPEVKP